MVTLKINISEDEKNISTSSLSKSNTHSHEILSTSTSPLSGASSGSEIPYPETVENFTHYSISLTSVPQPINYESKISYDFDHLPSSNSELESAYQYRYKDS